MRWSELLVVFNKDLTELSRKPTSVLLGILLPGIFMPVFVLSANEMQAKISGHINAVSFEVALEGESQLLSGWLQKSTRIKLLDQVPVHSSSTPREPGKNCDAVLQIPPQFDQSINEKRPAGALKVRYDSLKENSLLSVSFILQQLVEFKEQIVKSRLSDLGISSTGEPAFKFIDIDDSLSKLHLSRYHAASFLFLLVFSIYVASSAAGAEIVTAERERNTLEALLLTPTRRATIMQGKLLLMLAVTAACTLLTMGTYTCKYMTSAGAEISLERMIALEIVCLPLIAMLVLTVVSMSMLLAAYARTVQQSMGYSFYLALALFGAAGLSFNAAVPLASPAMFLPVSGIAIAIVDILTGRPDWPSIGLATASGALYCALFTQPAAQLLASDESLYNLQVSPEQRLREGRWGRPLLFLFVAVFLSMFYIGQAAMQWKGAAGIILTQVFCVLAPALVFLRLYKLPIKETLSWRSCRVTDLIGAACLAPMTVSAAGWLFALQSSILPAPDEFFKAMTELLLPAGTPWWQILAAAAVTPAICEELLFRGIFQGLLSRRMQPRLLAPVIGVIFGLFHFSLFRFIPTAALGTILSFLVIGTRSIFPAVVLHMSHNGLAALIGRGQAFELTAASIAVIVATFAAGIWLLMLPGRNTGSS